MKNALYLLALTVLFSITVGSASATVFRVNNGLTENIPGGLFSTLQRAHDNSSTKNGDTLMVEGSNKDYEGLSCTKRLVIIGPGYFLGENAGSNGVVTSATVTGAVEFKDGSQGSYFIGMSTKSYFYIYTSNIYVLRSNMSEIKFYGTPGCKVAMCYIGSLLSGGYGNTNIYVTNCVIGYDISGVSYIIYENNLLVNKYDWNISADTFRNNILLERDSKVNIKSPNIQNNLAPNAQFGTSNGNRAYEPADVFVGTGSSDGKYSIKATSPYIAAGYGGTQPGIFGGSEPYVLSGIPPVPIIYELNVPGTGSAATGLNINVKIRGAN